IADAGQAIDRIVAVRAHHTAGIGLRLTIAGRIVGVTRTASVWTAESREVVQAIVGVVGNQSVRIGNAAQIVARVVGVLRRGVVRGARASVILQGLDQAIERIVLLLGADTIEIDGID